jgi:alkylhydroperoxidase/carboxymuconolactone decarboxylase family protein YurZ
VTDSTNLTSTPDQRAWDLGARDALGQVAWALRLGVSPAQVLVVIDHLARGGTVTATMEALRTLSDQAAGQ